MAKLGKYSPKTVLPGEFAPRAVSPVLASPVVVRLLSGEKVQLLAPENALSRTEKRENHPWERPFSQVQTVPPGTLESGSYVGFNAENRSHLHGFHETPEEEYDEYEEEYEKYEKYEGGMSMLKGATDARAYPLRQRMTGSLQNLDTALPQKNTEEIVEDAMEDVIEGANEDGRQSPGLLIVGNVTEACSLAHHEQIKVSQDAGNGIEDETGVTSHTEGPEPVARLANNSPVFLKSSTESPWLTSPQPLISFSPEDAVEARKRDQINLTIGEVVQSEYAYVKSLLLLSNFFIEPLLAKCQGHQVTCTPLLNMDGVVRALKDKHERFLGRVSTEKDVARLAAEMTEVVGEPKYGSYAACAELLLYLVNRQMAPFELTYMQNLQEFLERNQPGELRMDLSLSLLLQKPMGRIAKYKLFLGSLAKLCPMQEQPLVLRAMELVNAKLMEINSEIRDNKERQAVLERVALGLDLSETGVPAYQCLGLLNLFGKCTLFWLGYNRRGPRDVVSRECHVLLHDNHILLTDARTQKLLFLLSFANCQLMRDVSGIASEGLCGDFEPGLALKIVFERADCQYEILLLSDSPEAHEALLRACENMSADPLRYDGLSDADCYVGPAVAQFDVNLQNPDVLHSRTTFCYFRQSYSVTDPPPTGFLFRDMGAMFRRSFTWQGPK